MINGFNTNDKIKKLLNTVFSNENLNINITYKNTRDVLYCENTHRYTDEKYILTVNGNDIDILCSGEKSAFYALCDINDRLDNDTLADGKFVCAPTFRTRGYIEGFYGTPWTHENRLSVLSCMAKNRMNTLYYAPKDDDYHRELWRDKYPEKDLMKLKEFVDTAAEYYMNFSWCIAPGLSIKYSDEAEFTALIEKTKQIYSIGIRSFGLLLDDISEELFYDEDKALYGETVNAHIDLIEKYHSALLEIDSSIKLTICPTLYNGTGAEYYISKLGQNISPLVSIFWTGRDICSRDLTSHEAVKFIEGTHHKPLYWDNYPVNDCAMYNEMHISPIINRDADLWKYSEGIISNCMEYAQCSKIPLITFARYLWDSNNYDAESSWINAINQVVGKENAKNFITFADNLYTSCLKDGNAQRFLKMLVGVEMMIKIGDFEKALDLADGYLTKMLACREYLGRDLPICKELKKWADKFSVLCDIMQTIVDYIKNRDKSVFPKLEEMIEMYALMPAKLTEESEIREILARVAKM